MQSKLLEKFGADRGGRIRCAPFFLSFFLSFFLALVLSSTFPDFMRAADEHNKMRTANIISQ
jgi:hypothetical protein